VYCTDIGDIDKVMPGFLDATREWFRIYKMPTGKPPNQFAFDGKFQDKVKFLEKQLVSGQEKE